jgi:ABC-2 type transport system permease protein
MMEYRSNFAFWAAISVMWTVFNFFMFGTIAKLNNGVAGWTFSEMMVLQAVFTIMDAFVWSWFYPSMSRFTDAVFDGHFIDTLLKPLDPFIVVFLKNGNLTNIPRLILGLAALSIWLPQTPNTSAVTPLTFLLFAAVLVLCFLLLFLTWMMLATLSFWVDKLSNINEIIPNFRRLYQIPRHAYESGGSFLFAFIVPLILVVSLPSEVLVNKVSWPLVGYVAAITIVTWWLARKFFFFSLQKFTGTGQS